jgi:GTP pyrophosphokinase
VAELNVDADTRAAGLLFAAPAYLAESEEKLKSMFGETVAALVAGISRINELRVLTRAAPGKGSGSQNEVLRKMLLAMVEDIRVVLLRLASRTQTLRWLARAPEDERRAVARETLDIYAPLANRLGVAPQVGLETCRSAISSRTSTSAWPACWSHGVEREALVERAMRFSRRLARASVQKSRPAKHLQHLHEDAGQIARFLRDPRHSGLRVLVDSVPVATALGVVHSLWAPIPKEFDDYISPKTNGYRSLHTAVIGPEGKAVEVQIRTHEMHREAELGLAAHWRYKEGVKRPVKGDPFGEKIALLRQMLAWRDEVVDASDWIQQSKRAALDDTIYALTPQGRVIDLPQGSTPVDFAYALHTDIGHRCRGAKVNGAIAPLDYRLKNADAIEIIVAKTGGPSRDWLNPALGYVQSSRARNKIRQWFNSLEVASVVAAGRAAVERELQREGKRAASLEELARRLGFDRTDEFFAAVGREEVGTRRLQIGIRGDAEPALPQPPQVRPRKGGEPDSGILVVGVERVLSQLAGCCKPAPPDRISGFVTKGRGVSVHRRECPSLARMLARHPERGIVTEWGEYGARLFPVDIVVRGNDRQGLLREVTEALTREKTNVIAARAQTLHSIASMHFTVEISDTDHLQRALSAIEGLRGVLAAVRR